MSRPYAIGNGDDGQRAFLVGTTGSGKSTLARALVDGVVGSCPVAIVDPKRSEACAVPGAQLLPTPTTRSRLQSARGDTAAELVRAELAGVELTPSTVIRWVPADPMSSDEYDAVYRWLFNRPPWIVWTDETGIVAPATNPPRGFRVLLLQGRERGLTHIACHTRPREVDPNVIAQAEHVMIFRLPNPADRAHVANLVGLSPAELSQLLDQLPPHGHVYVHQPTRTVDLVELELG